MTPKILHYCWFGRNPLPEATCKYIESWKKYCPDFQIIEWNEDNFDIHCCKFIEQAYEAKKWAFVADYARFYAMYHVGGIYIETDTELIRPINELLQYDAFFGRGPRTMTLPLCGTIKGGMVAESMLSYYHNHEFIKNGAPDLTTVNQILFNVLTTQYGLVANNQLQVLRGNTAVYPKEYFFSTESSTGIIKRNPKLFLIHYADASWLSNEKKGELQFTRRFIRYFGPKIGPLMAQSIIISKKKGIKQLSLKLKSYFYRLLTYNLMKIISNIYVNKKKIVFENFGGRGYGDNPKYIAQELITRNLGYDIVWIINKKADYKFPTSIRTVYKGSWREYFELATAAFWVDNNRKGKTIYKNKKQIYIQTWHGFYILKKIEKDAEKTLSKEYIKNAKYDGSITDLMVSGCRARTDLYKTSFWYTGKIMEWGTPRNDIFFSDFDYRNKIREFYKLKSDSKIVLYAPTFRDNKSTDAYNIDFGMLIESFKHRFNGDWFILVRLHPAVREKCNFINYNDRIINASSYPDIQELYVGTDFLITDYSNCMFEYIIGGKPVILYTSDLKEYIHSRDLYYDLHTLPFPIAENNEELNNIILYFDESKYNFEARTFLDKIGSFEDGKASKRVVDYIINQNNE